MKAAAIGFIILIIGVSGCATSTIPTKDAVFVPADRIFRTQQLPQGGNVQAVFVRDVGFTEAALYQHLFIDGSKAASLNPGEKVEFVLSPGEHIFGVVPTNPFGTYSLNTIDQDLKSGKRYFYRIQTDGNSLRTVIQRFFPDSE